MKLEVESADLRNKPVRLLLHFRYFVIEAYLMQSDELITVKLANVNSLQEPLRGIITYH